MKNRIILILTIIIFVFGCTKSQIRGSLDARSYANQYPLVTIFSIDHRDKSFAECLQRQLEEDLPNLEFIPGNKFREALFPWFEPSSAPKDIQELSNLLSNDLIRNRIEDLGVELLIRVQGVTNQSELEGLGIVAEGPGVVGAFGYSSAERKTHIQTTVWDLKKHVSLGDTDVHSQGKFRMISLVIPIPIPAFTESSACSETAKRISDCLTGKGAHTDKSDNLN
jgi:hypothetical protein